MKRIILSATSDLISDQRIHKIALTLAQNGYKVTVAGRYRRHKHVMPQRQYKSIRLKMLFNSTALFYAEFNLRLFFYLLFSRFDILVSNDLDTLPANVAVSLIRKWHLKKLVYDSHEYYTELPELVHRELIRKIWTMIEKILLPHIKHCYTVCESIAGIYNAKYGIDMKVVRNIPFRKKAPNACIPSMVKEIAKQTAGKKVIIYQGAVNMGRGIEKMLDALVFLPDTVFLIVGSGEIDTQISRLIQEKELASKVIQTGKVPFEQLPYYTALANIGISLEENLGLNYYYALPNKLFDYIHAGIPVLTSDFPEMRKIVEKYQTGFLIQDKSPQNIALSIRQMYNNQTLMNTWRANCKTASKALCWEKESEKLLSIYQKIS